MSAGGKVEAHKGVAGLHERHETFRIGGSPGMRLHISETAPEQTARPLDRKALGNIDELTATVIALSRQTLGVFVSKDGTLRLKHGAADDVLRGDEFDVVALAA